MLTVQNDWIQYESVPVRRVAVRGGGACAQRMPVVRERVVVPLPAAPAGRPAARKRLRLTRRGRLLLVVLPALLTFSGALVAAGAGAAQAAVHVPAPTTPAAGR